MALTTFPDLRTASLFAPRATPIPPNLTIGGKSPLLNTAVGGCDFSGTTITCAVAHGLAAGDLVRFVLDNPFAPLDPNARYYVLSSGLTTRTFQIALTLGGTPIDFGSPFPYVQLRNYGGRIVTQGVNDVWLYYVKPVLYKSTQSAVVFTTNPFGAYFLFQAAFGFSQHLVCTCADSLNVADSVIGRIQPIRASATESLSLIVVAKGPIPVSASESLSIAVDSHGPIQVGATESLTIAEAPNRGAQLFRHAITVIPVLNITQEGEVLNCTGPSDSAVVTLPKHRSVAEILTVIDEGIQTIGPGAFATESLSMSDAAQRPLTLLRTQIEALILSESVIGGRTNLRGAAEVLALSDSAIRRVILARRAIEALSIAVSVAGPGVIRVSASESLSLSTSAFRVWGAGRLASDSLNIADLASLRGSYHFFVAETLLIADSAHAARLRPASAVDTLVIASSATFGGNYGRQTSETLSLLLAANRRLALRRVVTQLLRLLEFPTAASGFAITASEALLIEEWAHWITGPHDPWEYRLDFRTGNLPLESTLDVPEAESIASVPEAESALDAPEAESELIGSTADSGLRYIDP